jgi:GMP synthase (glutamine-hydrolysing)
LKDNEFLKDVKKFEWIKTFDKPILGICAGMQIIGVLFGGKIKKKTEIGFYSEIFENEFLGLKGKQEVYHLHNNFIAFDKLKEFNIYCYGNGISQSVKHRDREIFGVLFHPEVRQKDLIKRFVELK